MYDPNNQFQITWDSVYAYPPQLKSELVALQRFEVMT
jgi:hypothetical protein